MNREQRRKAERETRKMEAAKAAQGRKAVVAGQKQEKPAKKTEERHMSIIVARAKFKKDMETLINSYRLPAFVVHDLVAELEQVLKLTAEKQEEIELAAWECKAEEAEGQGEEG